MVRRVSHEKAPSTWPKLVSDMTRGWLPMERTSPSISPVRLLVKGIQSSQTAGHSKPPSKMPHPARNRVMPLKSLLETQRERSAHTSLDHPRNPGCQSPAKVARWRTQWEPGGWETARRVWVTRLRLAPPQTRLKRTKRLQLQVGLFSAVLPPLGTTRTPVLDPSLLSWQHPKSSGKEVAACLSMKGGHTASRATPQTTWWGLPRCVCPRCSPRGRCLLWRRALRQPL